MAENIKNSKKTYNQYFFNSFLKILNKKSSCILLQQLHYWLSKKNEKYGVIFDNKQWIRNSYESWHQQLKVISVSTIRRCFKELEEKGIVLSKTFEEGRCFKGGEQVKYFTINYDILNTLLDLPKTEQNTAKTKAVRVVKMNREGVQNEHPHISNNKQSYKKSLPLEEIKNSKNSIHGDDDNFIKFFKYGPAMLSTWKKIVEGEAVNNCGKKEEGGKTSTFIFLEKALSTFFKNDLTVFEEFCKKITTSKFLMGEKTSFTITLEWALKFSNLEKLLDSSRYGFGDREAGPFKKTHQSGHQDFIETMMISIENDAALDYAFNNNTGDIHVFQKIRQAFLNKHGEGMYKSWIMNARLAKDPTHDDRLIFVAPTTFQRDQAYIRYMSVMDDYIHQRMTFKEFEDMAALTSVDQAIDYYIAQEEAVIMDYVKEEEGEGDIVQHNHLNDMHENVENIIVKDDLEPLCTVNLCTLDLCTLTSNDHDLKTPSFDINMETESITSDIRDDFSLKNRSSPVSTNTHNIDDDSHHDLFIPLAEDIHKDCSEYPDKTRHFFVNDDCSTITRHVVYDDRRLVKQQDVRCIDQQTTCFIHTSDNRGLPLRQNQRYPPVHFFPLFISDNFLDRGIKNHMNRLESG